MTPQVLATGAAVVIGAGCAVVVIADLRRSWVMGRWPFEAPPAPVVMADAFTVALREAARAEEEAVRAAAELGRYLSDKGGCDADQEPME